jgi:hypothetical protein
MKARIAVTSAIAAVALVGVATAKTNKLTGAFLEDPPSSISVQVALNADGKAKTLKAITAKFTQFCTTEQNGEVFTTESVVTKSVPGSFKIKNINGKYRYSGTANGEDGYTYDVSGVVDKKGKHAEGVLTAKHFNEETGEICNNKIANWFADK